MQGETGSGSKLKELHRDVIRGKALGRSHKTGLQSGFPLWASRLVGF